MRAAWALGQTAYSLAAIVAAAWSLIAVLSTPAVLAIPGAAESWLTWAFVVVLAVAPASFIISAALGWIGYARGGVRMSLLTAPSLVVVNMLAAGGVFLAMQAMCGGSFVCTAG